MYLKDTLGKEGIQELIQNLSKDKGHTHYILFPSIALTSFFRIIRHCGCLMEVFFLRLFRWQNTGGRFSEVSEWDWRCWSWWDRWAYYYYYQVLRLFVSFFMIHISDYYEKEWKINIRRKSIIISFLIHFLFSTLLVYSEKKIYIAGIATKQHEIY